MSLRFGSIYTDGFYHVFNRGVDRRIIFNDLQDYEHFILLLRILNSRERINSITRLEESNLLNQTVTEVESQHKPLVEIYGYSLLNNHFHLVHKQVSNDGVSLFMKKLGSAYAQYFNRKNKRKGTLFEGRFKYITIENDFHLMKMISYVNRNHLLHNVEPPFPISSGYEMIRSQGTSIKHFKITEVLELFNDFPTQSLSVVQDIIEQRKQKKFESDMID